MVSHPDNHSSYSGDSQISHHMGRYYSLVGSVPDVESRPVPQFPQKAPLTDPELDAPISLAEVEFQVKRLVTRKAPGDDAIWPFMLKEGGPIITESLLHLFNSCWLSSSFPSSWNHAVIVPVPKESSARTFDKFRPISLLSIVSKLFDSIMNTRLQRVSDRHDWIPSYQASFRKHRTPLKHLIRLQQSAHSVK